MCKGFEPQDVITLHLEEQKRLKTLVRLTFHLYSASPIYAVTEEPQLIYDQNQLVAAVVKADIFQEFFVWQQQHQKPSLANAFAELRGICAEENYSLEVPPRNERSNCSDSPTHSGNAQYPRF